MAGDGQKLRMKKTSFPKNRIKVLLLENIHHYASGLFEGEAYQVKSVPSALDEGELAKKLDGVHILGIRSKTSISQSLLERVPQLLAIGVFGIGTNQVDLAACDLHGVAVFNAPFSNTRSVVELALGEILMILRRVFEKSNKLCGGIWEKSATQCFEVRGKRLGIVGYGNIGSQLSVLAEALGMEVYFYDVAQKLALGNAKPCKTLQELLKKVDVVTLHVDGRPENKGLVGKKELLHMRKGSYLINMSRGNVVDIRALAACIRDGHIAGAAIDVFPEEPKSNKESFSNPLQKFPNVILTPHIGGSTEEAQENIAKYVPARIIDFVNSGNTSMSANFPNVILPPLKNAHRIIHIHHNVPGMLAKVNGVFSDQKINVVGQYLRTNGRIGYTITDIETRHDAGIMRLLKAVPGTIKARILY
jgi:D-3-phosphoglycerate dehydrogenase / 2-oxoglutarate reductase